MTPQTAEPVSGCTRSHPHEEMSVECQLRTDIARLRRELAQLREDAVETVQHWGAYASDYFQEKHDLQGDVARLRGASTRSVTTKGE